MSMTSFEQQFGYARTAVTLANWRTSPFNRFAFQNASEMVRSAEIASAVAHEPTHGFGHIASQALDLTGTPETVAQFLERSSTDALVIMKHGRFVTDYAAATMSLASPHIVFSVSKSLTAILAGIAADDGLIDPHDLVTRYVPEAEGSAYADATVQNVLDMRVSLDFEEDYLDPEGAFARYRRATMWNPGGGDETLKQFIVALQKGPHPHGGPFRYRSPNSDLLGVIVERATGRRIADLFAQRLFGPLGCTGRASVTVDAEGTARTAGGISLTAHDLARVGEMMRNGGTARGHRIVSKSWVENTLNGGDREAWRSGDFSLLARDGSYRNKWYSTGFESGAFFAVGIHGQWLYVEPTHDVVIVKMSSQAEPTNDLLDRQCLAAFESIARMV